MTDPGPDPTGPSDPVPPVSGPDPLASITEALPIGIAATVGSDVTLALGTG